MTLEQIRKMSDDGLNRAVGLASGYKESGDTIISPQGYAPTSYPDYSRDLNAAMTLVPRDAPAISEFEYALMDVLDWDINTSVWRRWVVGRNPRNLCEAFLLWKGSAT